jgi:retron-type reverse transcriptase
LKIEYRN